MHIKRFEADTLEAALEQVRASLGPDALILSSRTVLRGRSAFGLLARRGVEVQAAAERGSVPKPARPEAADDLPGLVDALRRALAGLRRSEGFEEEIRSELVGLRRALGARGLAGDGASRDGAVESLAHAGLDGLHARSLVDAWRAEGEDGRGRSLGAVLQARIEARLAPPRCDDPRRIRVLVGAPGSGKTTSLAKLAGRSEEGEREVAFVSLDPFRIGARDQLRTYAALLDAPFCPLEGPAGLPEIARRHPGHAILVDTAGRSPADADRLAVLDPFRGEGAEALRRETSIELVVDATARIDVARAQLARFAPLAPDRLLLTKLDECDSLVPVVNLLLDERCPPVCWLGTGQRVPEDLEIAEPAPFVDAVMRRAA